MPSEWYSNCSLKRPYWAVSNQANTWFDHLAVSLALSSHLGNILYWPLISSIEDFCPSDVKANLIIISRLDVKSWIYSHWCLHNVICKPIPWCPSRVICRISGKKKIKKKSGPANIYALHFIVELSILSQNVPGLEIRRRSVLLFGEQIVWNLPTTSVVSPDWYCQKIELCEDWWLDLFWN